NQQLPPLFNSKGLLPQMDLTARVYVFEEHQHRNIWIGTKGEGVLVLKGVPGAYSSSAFANVQLAGFAANSTAGNTLSDNDAYDLHEDRYGQRWVALYHGGVNIIRNPFGIEQQVMHYLRNENDKYSLSDSRARCFLEDQQGNMWIG